MKKATLAALKKAAEATGNVPLSKDRQEEFLYLIAFLTAGGFYIHSAKDNFYSTECHVSRRFRRPSQSRADDQEDLRALIAYLEADGYHIKESKANSYLMEIRVSSARQLRIANGPIPF